MTTAEQVKQRLLALQPGDSGVRVTNAEMTKIEVPGIAAFDLKAKAEWLQRQVPFPCSVTESATTGDWVYGRLSN